MAKQYVTRKYLEIYLLFLNLYVSVTAPSDKKKPKPQNHHSHGIDAKFAPTHDFAPTNHVGQEVSFPTESTASTSSTMTHPPYFPNKRNKIGTTFQEDFYPDESVKFTTGEPFNHDTTTSTTTPITSTTQPSTTKETSSTTEQLTSTSLDFSYETFKVPDLTTNEDYIYGQSTTSVTEVVEEFSPTSSVSTKSSIVISTEATTTAVTNTISLDEDTIIFIDETSLKRK